MLIVINRVDKLNMKTIRYCFFILFLLPCLTISAFSGRRGPYFPYFGSQYVFRGVILDNELFYHSSYVDLYSPKIKIIDDFGLGIEDTIVLLPDTTNINNNDPILETGWYLTEGGEYIVDFRINGYGQKCYTRFLAVSNGKVMGNLTNWQEFLLRRLKISPRGMSVERFEKKVKKKLYKKR